ncbi:MAG: hypothetical protein U0X92_00405 [Anaerolineales bacterium]
MAEASGVALKLKFEQIPFISCARKYAEKGCFAGGAFDNKSHFESRVKFADLIDEENQQVDVRSANERRIVAWRSARKVEFVSRLRRRDQSARLTIGRVEAGGSIHVE